MKLCVCVFSVAINQYFLAEANLAESKKLQYCLNFNVSHGISFETLVNIAKTYSTATTSTTTNY